MEEHYDHKSRDVHWQQRWRDSGFFTWKDDRALPKAYVLEMFPYTSGRLHIGHARNYSMGDTYARLLRARGFSVLYPMGWDAFGLPAENAAVKLGVHPAQFTRSAIASMRSAMERLGISYSWSNELSTCSPEYIRAQQSIFLRLFERGLIARETRYVNWDPVEKTVLANEQVIDGKGWRSGAPIIKRKVPQWFFQIRMYADELYDEIDNLSEWPEAVRNIQRSWIGRTEGVEIDFRLRHGDGVLTVFTTRADTLAGCTYLALAPEHPLSDDALPEHSRASVDEFRNSVLLQPGEQRATSEKNGIFTGLYALNPLTSEPVPIYVANYVLPDYGTGAIMGVPAHDERDFEFATKMGLPVRRVILTASTADDPRRASPEEGVVFDSAPSIDGLTSEQARREIVRLLSKDNLARWSRQYRIQNWSLSRQRYWGCPIPIIHCSHCGAVPVPDGSLPVLLPEAIITDGAGSPLSRDPSYMNVPCPRCQTAAQRDPDTMDTFVDSSWYFLRFPNPGSDRPIDREICDRVLPVDVYIGGIEHATLHLIYARFMTKMLRDLGWISFGEPFKRLFNQGMVNDELGRKQSKSLGNVVEPLEVVESFGADALRVYLLFKTTHNAPINWENSGPRSARQYLDRVFRLVHKHRSALQKYRDETVLREACAHVAAINLWRKGNAAAAKIQSYVENFHFNTAIAVLMGFTNDIYGYPDGADQRALAGAIRLQIRLLGIFAPHSAEELWELSGRDELVASQRWPEPDPAALDAERMTLPVQINGKTVMTAEFDRGMTDDEMVEYLLRDRRIRERVGLQQVRKVIHVPNRIINLVIG